MSPASLHSKARSLSKQFQNGLLQFPSCFLKQTSVFNALKLTRALRSTKKYKLSLWLKPLLNIEHLTLCLKAWKEETLYETEYFSFGHECKHSPLWQISKERRFILRTVKYPFKLHVCTLPRQDVQLHVITHREQQRQAFINITCKSVPSSPEHLGVRALWELWSGNRLPPPKKLKMLEWASVEIAM